MKRVFCAALLGAVTFIPAASAQRDLSQVEIRTEHAGGQVYALFGAGGNIGVLKTDDGVILIDDQFAPLSDKIKAAVKAISDKPIRFLLNTHWHGDHTGGNENFGGMGVVIVAHDNVYRRLSTPQTFANADRNTKARPKAALPVITYNDELSFHVGETTHVVHVPHAHTDGDSVVFFTESNVVHMGDLLFVDRYPFIDLDSGGNLNGVIAGVKATLEITGPDTVFIGGHGPLAHRDRVEAYLRVLETARDRVQALIDAGKSKEEVIAARPMAEYDETWGSGFIKPDAFLAAVYQSLTSGAE
ncbi:MAG: MBL fold metallo-hydrolase [Alphaproteobacteria bacterium]|nr:MAG: MBL fold metallo-hydrolase [Alphaproteobacteria bacterium]